MVAAACEFHTFECNVACECAGMVLFPASPHPQTMAHAIIHQSAAPLSTFRTPCGNPYKKHYFDKNVCGRNPFWVIGETLSDIYHNKAHTQDTLAGISDHTPSCTVGSKLSVKHLACQGRCPDYVQHFSLATYVVDATSCRACVLTNMIQYSPE